MPIMIRPFMSPDQELDLTRALTSAVAHELWKHCGGNEVVNWLEAERLVAALAPRPKRRMAVGGRHAAERAGASRRGRQEPDRITGTIPRL